ncbi:hypothetical protein AVEN_166530-1 [Araneus ventricosus]|uniref:Histone-lysine N-methyltransferase SETMAR n=1 Tax=Araneus ventricosus TaxID=182803 RepID=A0A4Y2HDQ9_ARAVE|nr:hypothetical protein AVEN_166530-1 [Araneus ventricosus]
MAAPLEVCTKEDQRSYSSGWRVSKIQKFIVDYHRNMGCVHYHVKMCFCGSRSLLLHDNARTHTAHHTIETTKKIKFSLLEHLPYSPDLSPFDSLVPR